MDYKISKTYKVVNHAAGQPDYEIIKSKKQ